jgi:DNA-binding XRE family transcriptional regulator
VPLRSPDQKDQGVDDSLATYIRRRRIELDITKAEAARRAGVSRRTWHEVEAGDRTTSTAVTLAQFDQALQLPEGTLWRLTASSTLQAADDLKRRAVALVRSMSYAELEYFVAHKGTETLIAKVDAMANELRQLRLVQELLQADLSRDDGAPGSVDLAQGGDHRRAEADTR